MRSRDAHLLVGAAALALGWVPLFGLLGFEYAAAMGWFLAHVSGLRAARAASRARVDIPRPFPGEILLRTGAVNLSLLLPPLAIAGLHALRVPNCNWAEGLRFYALLPLPAVLYGTSCGFAAGLAARRARAAFLLWSLLVHAASIAWLLVEPPKFSFNPFVGFFPGPIYDSEIPVTATLVVARGRVVMQALLVVLAAVLAWDGRALRAAQALRAWRGERAVLGAAAVLVATALLALEFHLGALGVRPTRGGIQRGLGGTLRGAHVDLHYDRAALAPGRAAALLDEHEMRWEQLASLFQVAPAHVGSYVYASAEQKKRLMGAGATSFEDALHDEFHINAAAEVPHPVLTHEMAHIFAAAIDRWRPVCLRMGIHEGIAVAAEWKEESARLELTPHQACVAMESLGVLPDLEKTLSAWGFWTQPGARAYTAAGSFVRHLVDAYGMPRFHILWRSGGDFRAAYGKSLRVLLGEWRTALAAAPVGPRELRRAERLFRPPAIFQQPCAHELARLEAEAAAALAAGDAPRAADLYRRLATVDPENAEHTLDLAAAELRAGRLDPARAAARSIVDATRPDLRVEDRAWRLLAEVAWLRDDRVEADSCYARAASLASSSADRRLCEVARAALADPRLTPLREYLCDLGRSEAAGIAAVARARQAAPDSPWPRYLLGRRLYLAGEAGAAADELRGAVEVGPAGGTAALTRETHLAALDLLGRSQLLAGRPEEARAAFDRLLAEDLEPWRRLGLEDWRERCGWSLGRTAAPPAGASLPDGDPGASAGPPRVPGR